MVKITPDWLRGQLDQTDFERIENAIAAAESVTSGEIVPIIACRSSSVSHIPVILFLSLWNVFLLADLLLAQSATRLVIPSWAYLLYFLASLILSRFLAEWPLVQRKLLEFAANEQQVRQRAEAEFYRAGLQKTDGNTGVLIFVSYTEHQAVILADKSIADKLPEKTWQEIIDQMLVTFKKDGLTAGLEIAIVQVGELLAPHFPRLTDDRNELKDGLIILDN